MPLSPELQKAMTLIQEAREIIDGHMMTPIIAATPYDARYEMLRRIQASEHAGEAEVWVSRLDPDLGKASGHAQSIAKASIKGGPSIGERACAELGITPRYDDDPT